MASVTKTTNELFRGPATLLIADSGTQPTEELGYTREGLEVSVTRETAEDYVQEVLDRVDQFTTRRNVAVAGQLAQFNIDALGRILGITPEASSLPLSGDPEELEVALRAVGSTKNGSPIHLYMARARAAGNTQWNWQRQQNGSLPFRFEMMFHPNNRLLRGPSSAQTATLASDVFARTNATPTKQIAWYKLSGQSGAADDLADITGATDLVDGEVVRIQIASTTMPITVKHGSGVIELKGASDFTLTKLTQWIDLYYDLAGTAWKEITRYEG